MAPWGFPQRRPSWDRKSRIDSDEAEPTETARFPLGDRTALASLLGAPSSGLRPPSPALGRRDSPRIPRWGIRDDDPALGSRDRIPRWGAGTRSRVGEQGQDPALGEQGQDPALGEQGQDPALGEQGQDPALGEQGQDRVTSPAAGRGRSGPAGGSRAGEGPASAQDFRLARARGESLRAGSNDSKAVRSLRASRLGKSSGSVDLERRPSAAQ